MRREDAPISGDFIPEQSFLNVAEKLLSGRPDPMYWPLFVVSV